MAERRVDVCGWRRPCGPRFTATRVQRAGPGPSQWKVRPVRAHGHPLRPWHASGGNRRRKSRWLAFGGLQASELGASGARSSVGPGADEPRSSARAPSWQPLQATSSSGASGGGAPSTSECACLAGSAGKLACRGARPPELASTKLASGWPSELGRRHAWPSQPAQLASWEQSSQPARRARLASLLVRV